MKTKQALKMLIERLDNELKRIKTNDFFNENKADTVEPNVELGTLDDVLEAIKNRSDFLEYKKIELTGGEQHLLKMSAPVQRIESYLIELITVVPSWDFSIGRYDQPTKTLRCKMPETLSQLNKLIEVALELM